MPDFQKNLGIMDPAMMPYVGGWDFQCEAVGSAPTRCGSSDASILPGADAAPGAHRYGALYGNAPCS